jgi:RNA processing factor Prp31
MREAARDNLNIIKIADVPVSFDDSFEKAIHAARSIVGVFLPYVSKHAIHDPRQIKSLTDSLDASAIETMMLVTDEIDVITRKVQNLFDLGFDCVELASISPDNEKFLRLVQKTLVPRF